MKKQAKAAPKDVRAKVLAHNIMLSVGKVSKGEIAQIPFKEFADILDGDKKAGREIRLELQK